jgi:hypothetical protein
MTLHYEDPADDALPEPDAELLASANRMLMDRLAGVAHVLRGCGLPALASIDDGEDMQPHVAALVGAYQMALADLANDLQLIGILKRNLANKDHEVEHLYAQLEQQRRPTHTGGDVIGYHVAESIEPDAPTLTDAINLAKSRAAADFAGSAKCTVIELRKVGAAVRSSEWVPA